MSVFLLVRPNCKIGSKINHITFGENESLGHLLLKSKMCYEIMKAGGNFITEASFKRTNKRADILSDLGPYGTIYEVLHSETIENCMGKVKQYPHYVRIVACWEKDGEIKTQIIREGSDLNNGGNLYL